MDLEPLNDPELCRDTPIGDLVVMNWCGRPHVAIVDRPDAAPRIVHVLEPGSTVLDAIYGKRTFELPWLLEFLAEEQDAQRRFLERDDEQLSEDIIHEQEKLERRVDGFRDLMRHVAGEV